MTKINNWIGWNYKSRADEIIRDWCLMKLMIC